MTAQAAILVEKGLESHKMNNLKVARSCYEQALSVEPNYEDALHLLGMLSEAEGDSATAVDLIKSAIKRNPQIAIFRNNLGNIYFNRGEFFEAGKSFAAALKINPNYLEAQFNLANVQYQLNEVVSAKNIYKQIILSNPDFIPAITNLIEIYLESGDYSSAYKYLENNDIVPLDNALKQKYIDVMALYFDQVESPALKSRLLNNIIEIDADNVDAIYNLANMKKESGDFDEAEKYYQRVLSLDAGYFGALVNSGVIDTWHGRFEVALRKFEKALVLNPDDYALLNNLGMTYQAVRDCDNSKIFYEKAIVIDGDKPEAYWNYSLLLLLTGDYGKGWEYYEYRWEVAEQMLSEKRDYEKPKWQGESLDDKSLFVYCEQGYGDSIQFARYLLPLLEGKQRVVLECPRSLGRLFHMLGSQLEIVHPDDGLPDFDYHIPMMSLPLVFKTKLESVPNVNPYLKTEIDDSKKWRDYFPVNGNRKIGIVWAGNPRKQNKVNNLIDQRRSCVLEDFSTLFDLTGVEFYS